MNKMLDKYAERHGFQKEWRLAAYGSWFTEIERMLLPEKPGPEAFAPMTRDLRIRSAFLMGVTLEFMVAVTASLAVWVLLKAIDRTLHYLRRPSYYEQERKRRESLRAERRKIRRRSTQNPCPTREALLMQFAKAKDSPTEMLRFGSMLEDLECYVDNSLIFDGGGHIIGRQHGIRGWLQEHCQPLFARYKTVMRYKSMAKKFRQVAEVRDPVPAAVLLGNPVPDGLQRQAEAAEAFLASCGRTQIDVLWQLERRLNPDWIMGKAGEAVTQAAG